MIPSTLASQPSVLFCVSLTEMSSFWVFFFPLSSFSYFPVAAARADELDLTGKAFIKHREKLESQRQLKDEVKQTALAK